MVPMSAALEHKLLMREYECGFLKRNGVHIVCVFTGTDIRSPKLMKELETTLGRPNVATYQGFADRATVSKAFDETTRRGAPAPGRKPDHKKSLRTQQTSFSTRPNHTGRNIENEHQKSGTTAEFSTPARNPRGQ